MTELTPEEALAAASSAVAKAAETSAQAAASSALVPTKDDALATKRQLGAAFGQVTTARKEALDKVKVAKEMIEAKKRELDEMARNLAAELAPLEKQLARFADGIAAVNLYLGRDEELEELLSGESAPADTPLVIRQSVLAMDEESALLAEEGGLDFQQIDTFIEWLTGDRKHLDQVIPDLKGVVAIMARRTPVDYTGNPLADAELNTKNFHTWWLMRNGERLYLMTTDFSVGEHLIPTRRSFTKLFEDRNGDPLEPGSRAWLEAEERADVVTRHYMKVALILQGLVDRTAVFHPLPEGGLNLIANDAYDTGRVVLVEDEEKAIGTGRQPFREWQKERISLLEVGHRVIGYFPGNKVSMDFRDTRITPQYASNPASDEAHVLAREDGGNFYFPFKRTDTVDDYDRWGSYLGQREPKTRATYRLPKNEWGDASYIPIDTVEIAEMEEYLDARTERGAYKTMFPALLAAIAFKRAEEEVEAPFRALLATKLETTDEEVKELVKWWKTANKWHRALHGDQEHERKAMAGIVKEYERRHTAPDRRGLEALHAVADAMVLAKRTNDLIAVVPEPRKYGASSVPQDLYVAVHVYSPTGKLKEIRHWQTLTKAQVAKWTILGETEQWASWKLNPLANTYLSDDAIAEVIDQVISYSEAAGIGRPFVINYFEDGKKFPKVVAHYPSRRDDTDHWGRPLDHPKLEQPYVRSYLEMKGGKGTFVEDRRYKPSTHDWRIKSSWDREEGPEAPHLVNYTGHEPESTVYTDQELLAQEWALGAAWFDEYALSRKRSNAIQKVALSVLVAWEDHELEQRRQRFIEDFGDADLWEDHAKSQKAAPFPLRSNAGSEPIQALAEAVVSQQVETAGRTLEDVLGQLDITIEGIPEVLLPVRFRESH